jgi:hypothetical protein
MISRQRRWSPRSTTQGLADTFLGVWLLLMGDKSVPLGDLIFTLLGALAVAGVGLYVVQVSRGLPTPRRPILLVVDDLDRCTEEKTVA